MTKDRLRELQEKANLDVNSKEEWVVADRIQDETMNNFMEQMRAIALEIQTIRNRLGFLKKFQIQMEICTNEQVKKELDEKIKMEQQIILETAKNTRESLKLLQQLAKEHSPAMERIKNTQIRAQMKMLTNTMQDYMNCLQVHRDRSLLLFQQMIQVSEGNSSEDVEALLDKGKTACFVNNLLLESLEEKVDEVDTRYNEILAVEQTIRELRDLFIELAFAVNTQGEKIICLDKHVLKTIKKVEHSKKDIIKAKKKMSKFRWRKIIIACVCTFIVILLLILVIIL